MYWGFRNEMSEILQNFIFAGQISQKLPPNQVQDVLGGRPEQTAEDRLAITENNTI